MKKLSVFILAFFLGAITTVTTLSLFADKTPVVSKTPDYEDGFRDGRVDGYHAAIEQMNGCFKNEK